MHKEYETSKYGNIDKILQDFPNLISLFMEIWLFQNIEASNYGYINNILHDFINLITVIIEIGWFQILKLLTMEYG